MWRQRPETYNNFSARPSRELILKTLSATLALFVWRVACLLAWPTAEQTTGRMLLLLLPRETTAENCGKPTDGQAGWLASRLTRLAVQAFYVQKPVSAFVLPANGSERPRSLRSAPPNRTIVLKFSRCKSRPLKLSMPHSILTFNSLRSDRSLATKLDDDDAGVVVVSSGCSRSSN